jgi:hypothetical protein
MVYLGNNHDTSDNTLKYTDPTGYKWVYDSAQGQVWEEDPVPEPVPGPTTVDLVLSYFNAYNSVYSNGWNSFYSEYQNQGSGNQFSFYQYSDAMAIFDISSHGYSQITLQFENTNYSWLPNKEIASSYNTSGDSGQPGGDNANNSSYNEISNGVGAFGIG